MENQLFVSMLGSSSIQQNRDSKKTETNSGAFTSCLEAATSDKAGKENDVIAKKETRKEAAERQRTEKAEAQAQAKAEQAKMTQNPQSMGGKAFLYDMMYRNPDTLSMAEKQAMKLDEASKNLKMQNMQPKENAEAAKGAKAQTANQGKEATALSAQKFDELLGKSTKAKEDGKQLTTEASQAASSTAKGDKADKADANTTALNTASRAEETNKTQRLTQTQKRQQVINQIVTHMEIRNFTSRDELTLRLNPEYLGELKIKINRGKDGELSAQFITDSEDTREVLQESRAELREHIEKKGMNLRSIDIEMVDHIA
ncbi:MAG: flagellar hook-length control protein FliK [Candidatus Bruticola sp.]